MIASFMSNPLRVLIVEDSVDDTFFIVRELQRGGYNVAFERVETHASMQTALEGHSWDLVISDYSMPRFSGPAALALFQQRGLDVPFVMVSGAVGEARAVEIVKAGAHDCLMKDELRLLMPAVKRELAAAHERRSRKQTEAAMAYLASIVQSCDDAIIGETLEGTIVSWNAGAERLYGFSPVEMIGRPSSTLVPADCQEHFAGIIRRIEEGGQVERCETVRLRKGRRPVRVSVTVSPIRDRRGRLVGISSVARGIAGSRQRESSRPVLREPLTAGISREGA
jgi:PAS domain S-box-containing protein